jgi:hypothetical protein
VLLLPQLVGHGVLEQAHGELDAEYPCHGIIDSAHWNDVVVDVAGQDVDEVVGHHDLQHSNNSSESCPK